MDLLNKYAQERTQNIMEVILSFARLDFDKKTTISDDDDVFDAISSGVNMLGEELENSTVTLKEKEQLLREKEQLLKEVHHRVKNNLQIISSLLNLQNEQTRDPGFTSLIRESQNRIYTMALVHEMLYASSGDLSHINAREYICNLSNSLRETFPLQPENIHFAFEMDEGINLELDVLIPLGLILNEIITNSIKYAFPDGKGEISIRFKREEGHYHLHIADNGQGFKPGFDMEKSESLGMQLIFMLAEQLQGTVEMEQTTGIGYKLLF